MEFGERIEKAEAALGLTLPPTAPTDGLEHLAEGYGRGRRSALADLVFDAAFERAVKNLIATECVAARRGDPDLSPQVVAIVGLPRTGSTLLHNIVALADGVTSISHLDAINPTWRVGAISQGEALVDVNARLDLMDLMSPGIRDRHPLKADWADECTLLLANSGGSYQWPSQFELPDHLAWLREADLAAHYDAYRRALGVVSDPGAETLVLKSPFHVLHLAELRRVIPGVRVVATVRASSAVVPSWFGLLEAAQLPLYGAAQLEADYVRAWTDVLEAMATCLVTADDDGLIDEVITYEALVADPAGTAQRLLDGDEAAVDPGLASRTSRWLQQAEAARTGPHASWALPVDGPALRSYDQHFGLVGGRDR